MNFLDKIFNRSAAQSEPSLICLSSSPEREAIDYSVKESRADKINYRGIGATEYGAGTPPAFYDAALDAVGKFPLVYGCVTAISEAIAALSVKVYLIDGGERVEEVDHPFYQLFTNPNPYQGSFEFLEEVQQSLDVTGNVFIAKEKVAGTYELYVLNPQYVAIIPDPKKKVKQYIYTINGDEVRYKPEEMIHIKYGSLRDPYYGPPPLNAAADILKFEENRLKFANQFFENGAVPAGVLETEQNLGDVLLKKLRGEWSNLHRGVKNAHKVAILQGGLTYKPLTTPIKDLDFSGLKKLSKEDILTIFKVPESVLGSQDGTGSKEGKDALTSFWRGCLIPRLHRLQSGLNRGLRVEIFGNGQYEFEFNLKAVAALQDDKNDIADYVEKMISASVMTPNEGRAIIGLAAMDDEYADKLMVSNSFWGNQKMPVEAAVAGVGGAGSNEELPAAAPPTQPKPKPTKPKAPKK